MTDIETLRAVYHPTRRRIIDYLHLHGPSQVGSLARSLDEQVGSISHHLRMLQRVGIVEPAPELADDGRTSWWRVLDSSMSWSVEDFDSPADRTVAKAAEKANIDYQLAKLTAWKRAADKASPEWRRNAFSTTHGTSATAEELGDLFTRVSAAIEEWTRSIDLTDGAEREPIFFFAHAFPTQP